MQNMGAQDESCPFEFNFDEKTFKTGDTVSYRVTGSLEGFPFVGTLLEVHDDYVIIAGVYNTSKASELGKVLDTEELVRDIALTGKPSYSLPDADAIVEHLAPELKTGDVAAIMSNGGFGGIHDKILNRLKI